MSDVALKLPIVIKLYKARVRRLAIGRRIEVQSYADGARLNQTCDLIGKCLQLETIMNDSSTALKNLPQPAGNSIHLHPSENNKLLLDVNATDCNNVAVLNGCFNDTIGKPGLASVELQTTLNMSNLFVVINLCGEHITWPNGVNLVGNWSDTVSFGRSKTIWNFYEAKTISLPISLKGYLLAPYAKVTLTANTEGSVAVKELLTTVQVHVPNLSPPVCLTTTTTSTSRTTTTTSDCEYRISFRLSLCSY